MGFFAEILLQTLRDIWAHKLRSTLTMFGVSWGIASIILMMAIGDGFKLGYRKMLSSMGTDIVILWGGRTRAQAGGQKAGRSVRFSYDDILAIQRECYLVSAVTPELANYLPLRSPFNSGSFSTHGIAPVYQEIRSMKLEGGRAITDGDFREARCVCVIGEDVKRQLFAGQTALGAQVFIRDVRFTVIGELAKKEQNNSYNGLDGNKVLIPYTTMAQYFPDPRPIIGPSYINNIIFTPGSADDHEAALRQVKTTLGRRHGFRATDEGAVWAWDTVESARMVATIYDSMQIFLTFVAVTTLGLGGLGVMNIMLVSVAERTREIGVKRAVGAKRSRILIEFFVESLALTVISGLAGVVFACAVCAAVNRLPLPTLFSGLPVTGLTAGIAFGTLVLVGIFSAIYPARHASLLAPVEALRHE